MVQRKILIVTNRVPYPLKDGGNLAMNAMIEGYHRFGWQVFLLAMNTSRHHVKTSHLPKLFTHIAGFDWLDVDNELKWTDIVKNFLFSKKPEHVIRFQSEGFKNKLKETLLAFNPDVVQMESVYLSSYLPVVSKHSHAITTLRLHNVEYQIWQGLARRQKGNALKQIYFNSLTERIRDYERTSWKEYDLLLPITEKDMHLVTRLEDINNILVAPFSIDTEKIKLGTNEQWVGYHIGAMDWIPNKEGIKWFLDQVWPRVHKALPKFEFYFTGRKMPREFKRLHLSGVFCLDEVADAEEFISDKKILIVPIASGGGVRVKILEAMAAGKIVITTTSGAKGIDAKPGEHYLLAKKPEEFTRAIKWCLDNRPQAEAMARRAYELIKEKYEYRKVIGDVINELEVLLGAHRY